VLTLLQISLFAQHTWISEQHDPETEQDSWNEEKTSARKYNLKQVTAWAFKYNHNKLLKDSTVNYQIFYDSSGFIVKYIDHNYHKNGFCSNTYFIKNGLVVEKKDTCSFWKDYFPIRNFHYDSLNRLSYVTENSKYNNGSEIKRYIYYENGKLKSESFNYGKFIYDKTGKYIEFIENDGRISEKHEYSSTGKLLINKFGKYQGDSLFNFTVEYTYDSKDRKTEVVIKERIKKEYELKEISKYAYNDADQLIWLSIDWKNKKSKDVMYIREYDIKGLKIRQIEKNLKEVPQKIIKYTYSYY